MRKTDLKLTIFYSLLACALFASCAADESAAESEQKSGIAGAGAAQSDDDRAAAGRTAPNPKQDAGSSAKPAQPSAAGSGAGGSNASAPMQSPKPPAAAGGSGGRGGSAAPSAASSGGTGGAAASSGGAGGASANSQPSANTPVVPQTVPTGQPAADGDIDTVMMDVAYVLGASGNLDPQPRPIIMFKDGWACRDINFVVKNLSVAQHKAMLPDSWVQWKVVDGKVALQKGMEWSKMSFQNKYPPNTPTLTFNKQFTFSHVATLANTSVFTKQSIRFMSDHSVVLGKEPADSAHRGTYQIDGYTIEIEWEDGSSTRTSFVWSDEDPAAIFIDGDAYLTRN